MTDRNKKKNKKNPEKTHPLDDTWLVIVTGKKQNFGLEKVTIDLW